MKSSLALPVLAVIVMALAGCGGSKPRPSKPGGYTPGRGSSGGRRSRARVLPVMSMA